MKSGSRKPNLPGASAPATSSSRSKAVKPAQARIASSSAQSGTPTKATVGFPIVGIGASAGGLESFTELLKHLPLDTGLGFVLVQHLDPHHQSALTQILKRATTLPVCEVTNELRVEANHVYIIPPNTNLTIAQGVLKLQPRAAGRALTRSIDLFFESLAQDQRERAIGVILSGTATDGTCGLEAIKAEGGITFAQDQSAKYNSMPRSAVAAGCVDFVLSPENIANELARIAQHPLVASHPLDSAQEGNADGHGGQEISLDSGGPRIRASGAAKARSEAKGAPDKALVEDGFAQILLLLRNHSGVDFSLYRSTTIQRRIVRRMVLNKENGTVGYAQFLKGNLKELDALYSDVLISVTSFFRNPEAFEVLKLVVFPKLLHDRPHDPVRVWALGCSTGQEAYSIAMAFTEFAEHIPHAPRLQIFATDLNDAVLDKARHALYAKGLVANVSPEQLRRFFVEEQGGYRINKALRETCVFARQNVLSDPPFSRIDLISCRNLLIYIEPSLQKKILPNFHYALKPGGFLFLGASESVGGFTNLFEPLDKSQKIFSRKPQTAPAYQLPISQDHPTAKRPIAARTSETASVTLRFELNAQREADRILVNRFAPPSVLINAELEVLQFRGLTSAFLEPPTGKATLNVLKLAREGLRLPLRDTIAQADQQKGPASMKNVRFNDHGQVRSVEIEVIPLVNLKARNYIILFDAAQQGGRAARSAPENPGTQAQRGALRSRFTAQKDQSRRLAELESELSELRDFAQSIQEQHEASTEELQASHEEVQSANEELQSINEELETSKEELESTNEELTTVNEEMAHRNLELHRLNNDLSNLHVSINTAILLLGRDLTIRRFTPLAEKTFNLLVTDVGRPLRSVRHNLEFPELEQFLAQVIDTVSVREQEVRDKAGRWFLLRARPYMTLDNKIDGAVLVLIDIDDLKRTQRAMSEARNYAEAVVAIVPPLLILDHALRVRTANESFYRLFRLSAAQTENCLICELDHGQWNIPQLRQLLESILPGNHGSGHDEVTHTFTGLGERTLLLSAQRVDHIQRILLSMADITDHLQLKAEVRRSELRYRRLFEAAKDGILILDPKTGKITDANPFMAEFLGYSKEAVLGKELWQIGLLKDQAASRTVIEELKTTGFIRYEDLPLATCVRREVEFISNLYREDGAEVIQCNIRDISERKQAEHKLAEKARLLDLTNDAIIVRDLDGLIVYWNQGAENLYGWRPEEAIGKSSHALLQTEFPNPPAQITEELLRTGHWEGEFRHTTRAGQRIIVLARKSLDRDSQGNPAAILQILTNITERKKIEDELHRAHARLADRAGQLEGAVRERTAELTATNHQLEAYIYSIAHDLRAPLRGMQGCSAMLLEEVGHTLSPTGLGLANRIHKSAQFMDALLKDLLAFSQVSQERIVLTAVHLEATVQAVLARLEDDIQERHAEVDCAALCGTVLAHEPTLGQVLFNLVSNALKFVKPGLPSLIRLRIEEKEASIRLWVEDNGIGIAPEHQEQIFGLFTRLHGERYPGTGIGLAIVQKGVERMRGRAGVESVAGEGSRFWFELPRAQAGVNHSLDSGRTDAPQIESGR